MFAFVPQIPGLIAKIVPHLDEDAEKLGPLRHGTSKDAGWHQCGANVQEGWMFDGAAFTPPVEDIVKG